ncbi:protein FAM177A1 [Chelmon rostratus]|uniref:protein FAM177A1 n=1 Tax=Chelmon rostratus TaxID=109905 RepID=UPI001BE6847A|nr:protein FAM177A1 [Chelmon rostratus]
MNSGHQETPLDIQETESESPAVSKQRRIIHFSSGETLEEDDSEEEEEQPSDRPAERTRFSFKNVAILVGRISLLTCDFLGERLAGALGLNAAKYQYAIDQHHRNNKTMSSQTTENLGEGRVETIHLTPGPKGSHYGATGDERRLVDLQESCDDKHTDRNEGCHNKGYQADDDYLE